MIERKALNRRIVAAVVCAVIGFCLTAYYIQNFQTLFVDSTNTRGALGGLAVGIMFFIIGLWMGVISAIELKELHKNPRLSADEKLQKQAEENESMNGGREPVSLVERKVRIEIYKQVRGNRKLPKEIIGIIRRELFDTEGYRYELIESDGHLNASGKNAPRYQWFLISSRFEEVELATMVEIQRSEIPIFIGSNFDLQEILKKPFDSSKMDLTIGYLSISEKRENEGVRCNLPKVNSA